MTEIRFADSIPVERRELMADRIRVECNARGCTEIEAIRSLSERARVDREALVACSDAFGMARPMTATEEARELAECAHAFEHPDSLTASKLAAVTGAGVVTDEDCRCS